MSRKVFDYAGISKIGITGSTNLLERIAENMESEISESISFDCRIDINQAKTQIEIKKDKRFDYLTIEKTKAPEQHSIKYTRYNTPVRTIHEKSDGNYAVDVNVVLDEASGLICVRNHLNNHPVVSQYPLLHASLVNLNGKGILISSDSRQGKTTSAIYFLQELGATFVGDENVFLNISQGSVKGLYVPRTSRVRFSTIAESGLSKALEDVLVTNATQYIDPDAIQRIIESKSFDIDAGMAFSRKAFCNLLGTTSQESSAIGIILFPKYSNDKSVRIKRVGLEEGVERLSKYGLTRKSEIDQKELQKTTVQFQPSQFKGIDFIEVEFSGMKSLRNGGFRL